MFACLAGRRRCIEVPSYEDIDTDEASTADCGSSLRDALRYMNDGPCEASSTYQLLLEERTNS
jgi:hypothetical protein